MKRARAVLAGATMVAVTAAATTLPGSASADVVPPGTGSVSGAVAEGRPRLPEAAARGSSLGNAAANRQVRRVLRVAARQSNHGGRIDDRPRALRVRLATVGAPAPVLRRVVRTARTHGVTVRFTRSPYTQGQLQEQALVAARHPEVETSVPHLLGRALRVGVSPQSPLLELTQSAVRAELGLVVRVRLETGVAVPW
jgi:hypothetical protein